MNRPSTAKEALIAEALGEIAVLIERVEAVVPALDASRRALVLSHEELVNEVAIFKTQMAQVIGFAKVETSKHIGKSADDSAKKLIAIQIESLQAAGRELFRAEFDPVVRQIAHQLQQLAERQNHHRGTCWSYTAAVVGGVLLTWAFAVFWRWFIRW